MTLHTEPSRWPFLPNFYIQYGINSGRGGVEPISRARSRGTAELFCCWLSSPSPAAAIAFWVCESVCSSLSQVEHTASAFVCGLACFVYYGPKVHPCCHIAMCCRISFFFKAEWYFTLGIYHILLIHSSMHGLSCFTACPQNNATFNMGVQAVLISLLFSNYPENRLPHHMLVPFLLFFEKWDKFIKHLLCLIVDLGYVVVDRMKRGAPHCGC